MVEPHLWYGRSVATDNLAAAQNRTDSISEIPHFYRIRSEAATSAVAFRHANAKSSDRTLTFFPLSIRSPLNSLPRGRQRTDDLGYECP
ncbi:hypothetical protein EVAR_8835_1 [Eumeta japonica]|uniref:Uncharacterized protein n=1 Tax=Eumeta variegata TaxID=151549 RepID=A0A4C1TUM5_EUMVA|nr:hypothetical protein EVAR_8835_1 [Eumeta japonica]